jgi:hypothetical protein
VAHSPPPLGRHADVRAVTSARVIHQDDAAQVPEHLARPPGAPTGED